MSYWAWIVLMVAVVYIFFGPKAEKDIGGCFKLIVTTLGLALFFNGIGWDGRVVPVDGHASDAGIAVLVAKEAQRAELPRGQHDSGTTLLLEREVQAVNAELNTGASWLYDANSGRTWAQLVIRNPSSHRLNGYLLKVTTYSAPQTDQAADGSEAADPEPSAAEREYLDEMRGIAGPDADLRFYLTYGDFLAMAQEVYGDEGLPDLGFGERDTHYFELYGVEIEQGGTAYPTVELDGFDLKAEGASFASIDVVEIVGFSSP